MASNPYGLPDEALAAIRERDQTCVYCHKVMVPSGTPGPRFDWATIEHLNHLPPWDNPETVAICCMSCNSSRRDWPIRGWFETDYCRSRGINAMTVAKPVRDYLATHEGRG